MWKKLFHCFLKKLVRQNVRQTFVFVGQFLRWVGQCPMSDRYFKHCLLLTMVAPHSFDVCASLPTITLWICHCHFPPFLSIIRIFLINPYRHFYPLFDACPEAPFQETLIKIQWKLKKLWLWAPKIPHYTLILAPKIPQ